MLALWRFLAWRDSQTRPCAPNTRPTCNFASSLQTSSNHRTYHNLNLHSKKIDRMGWLGFTLDSPISHSASAYDKMDRSRSDYRKGIPLPKKPKPPKDKSSSFLSSIRKSVSKSASPSIAPKPSSNLNTPFLKLPPKVREQIYGYVVGKEEVLHVLLRRRTARKGYYVGFRRCRAGGGRRELCDA